MSIVKKSISVILCVVLVIGSAFMIAGAAGSYTANARWTEITKSEADSKFNKGEKFIVVFFQNSNPNCQSVGDSVLSTWMDTYSYNIYGVNADTNNVSEWVYTKIKDTAITFPVVCFAENKDATVFSGAGQAAVNGMKAKFYDFAGIKPESTYKLIYDTNGGGTAPNSIIDNGSITLSKVVPARDGYRFLGWSKNKSATVANYSAGSAFELTEDTTLYAVWEKYDGPASYSFSVVYNQSEARKMLDMINQFRQSGNAWYWNSDNTTKESKANLAKLTYDYELEKAAMIRAAEIVARFERTRPNDEDVINMISGNGRAENITYGQESAAKAEEYFEAADKNYQGQTNRRNLLSEDITAVGIACVQYEGRNYWVQLFRNPVSSAAYTMPVDTAANVEIEIFDKYINSITVNPSVSSIALTVGTSSALPTLTQRIEMNTDPKNTLVGLKAADWKCDDPSIAKIVDGEVIGVREGSTTIRGNYGGTEEAAVKVTVDSNPGPAEYKLSFDGNGGDKAPAAQTGNGETEITAAIPERKGYTFLGWSLAQSAETPQFNPGGKFELSANTTLYAVWRKNPSDAVYTLSFDYKGGSNGPVNMSGSGYITISEKKPAKSGYTFLGWGLLSDSATVKYEPGDKFNLNADTTLYAIWKEGGEEVPVTPPVTTSYTLTYNANGGENAPAAQTGNGTVTLSATAPVRAGYVFLGWAATATGSAQYKPGDKFNLTKNTTLYAEWTNEPIKGHGTLTLDRDAYYQYVGDTFDIKYSVTDCNEEYMIIVESENNEIAYAGRSNVDPEKKGSFPCVAAKEGEVILTVSLRSAKNGDVYDIKTTKIHVQTPTPASFIVRFFRAIRNFVSRIIAFIIAPIVRLIQRIREAANN